MSYLLLNSIYKQVHKFILDHFSDLQLQDISIMSIMYIPIKLLSAA